MDSMVEGGFKHSSLKASAQAAAWSARYLHYTSTTLHGRCTRPEGRDAKRGLRQHEREALRIGQESHRVAPS